MSRPRFYCKGGRRFTGLENRKWSPAWPNSILSDSRGRYIYGKTKETQRILVGGEVCRLWI